MQDIADRMIEDWMDPDIIEWVTWLDDYELAERYLENWHTIKDTAEELWLDEEELLDTYWGDYDYD